MRRRDFENPGIIVMKKTVLGVKIDDVGMDEAVKAVLSWLKKGGKHYIVTPNPEIVMMAQSDRELKEIINQADLAVPDGVGLRLSGDIVCHTPGIDLMETLIKEASEKGFTIGLLGGRGKVAEVAAERLLKKYPKLKISFASGDMQVNQIGMEITSSNLQIQKTDLLFVAFGPSKQEKWIFRNLAKLPVRVAMGVGGSFDYIAGKVPRAPRPIRELGLEWLFRLGTQPWRIKRQLALLKFFWLTMRQKSKS